MTIKEVQKFKADWLKMTELEKWHYVIAKDLEITLDNDNTTAFLPCTEDEDMGEVLEFEEDLGNRSGVENLLKLFSIRYQRC